MAVKSRFIYTRPITTIKSLLETNDGRTLNKFVYSMKYINKVI